jgi:hypothetical protein
MEAGVEASNLGQVRTQRPQSTDGGEAGRVVQGSQICQRFERIINGVVEDDGVPEFGATVDDSVAGRLELRVLIEERIEHIFNVPRVRTGSILGSDHPVCVVQQAKLQTARAGVDDKNIHVPTMPDRTVTAAD